jgi:hypothetical protein
MATADPRLDLTTQGFAYVVDSAQRRAARFYNRCHHAWQNR